MVTITKNFFMLVFALLATAFSQAAQADDFVWTGKSYIPIPAHYNQDIVITFPEKVRISFQQPSAVDQSDWDDHSVLIRPKVGEQEQRAYIKGLKSGRNYVARISSALPFVPFRTVIDGTEIAQEERASAAGTTQLGLMKAMMTTNGIPPPGFDEEASQRVLLDMAPFKITATAVWSSPSMIGVIATLASTIPDATIPIVPTNIQLRIPEYGTLKAMGADSWELSPVYLRTRIYLVFSR